MAVIQAAPRIFEVDYTCIHCGQKFKDNMGSLEEWCQDCLVKEPESDDEFLQQLYQSMHSRHIASGRGYGQWHMPSVFYYVERRKMLPKEWARVKKIAKNYIVVPQNAGMGFNFGLTFYKHPTFPGVPPEPIYSVEGGNLDLDFKKAFKKMSPLSHNEKNAVALIQNGFECPRNDDHYDY